MIFIIMSLLNIGPMSFQYRLTTSILFITKYHNYYTSQTYLSKKKKRIRDFFTSDLSTVWLAEPKRSEIWCEKSASFVSVTIIETAPVWLEKQREVSHF